MASVSLFRQLMRGILKIDQDIAAGSNTNRRPSENVSKYVHCRDMTVPYRQ